MKFVEHEYSDIGPVLIDELADVEVPAGHELVYIKTPGQQPGIPYAYDVTHFPILDERRPGINIKTPLREVFLQHHPEAEAQKALVGLVKAIHPLSGGAIDIHPFFGAIYDDILDPVASDRKKKPGDFIPGFNWLSMTIHLVENGGRFSDTISDDAADIPLSFTVPSATADRFMANRILANRVNPNQSAKDQATANGLGKRWMAQFKKYNTADLLQRQPMAVDVGSVALLMNVLGDKGILNPTNATVRVRQPA